MSFDWTSFFGGAADYLLNDIEQKKGAERAKQLEADRRASELAFQKALMAARGEQELTNKPFAQTTDAQGNVSVRNARGGLLGSYNDPGALKKAEQEMDDRRIDAEKRELERRKGEAYISESKARVRQMGREPVQRADTRQVTSQMSSLVRAAKDLGDKELYQDLVTLSTDTSRPAEQRLADMNMIFRSQQNKMPQEVQTFKGLLNLFRQ